MDDVTLTPELVAWFVSYLPDQYRPHAVALILTLGTLSVIVVHLRAAVMSLQGFAWLAKRVNFKRIGAVLDGAARVLGLAKGAGEVLAAHKAPPLPPMLAKRKPITIPPEDVQEIP